MDFVKTFPKTSIRKVIEESSRIEVIPDIAISESAINEWISKQANY